MMESTARGPGNLRQYAERERRAYCAGTPNVSLAEHRRSYPVESYRHRWVGALCDAGRAGVVFSRATLDAVYAHHTAFFCQLAGWYPWSIPPTYLNPDVRRQPVLRPRKMR